MDSLAKFLVDVFLHFVAADTELFAVRGLKRSIESAPEDDTRDEAAQSERSDAVMHTGTADIAPDLSKILQLSLPVLPDVSQANRPCLRTYFRLQVALLSG